MALHNKNKAEAICIVKSNLLCIAGYQSWTIHGIWPAMKQKPPLTFCNTSIGFDPSKILSIFDDLNLDWTNDHASSDQNFTLWQFEWLKYGSCVLSMNSLNDEFKYFSKVSRVVMTMLG